MITLVALAVGTFGLTFNAPPIILQEEFGTMEDCQTVKKSLTEQYEKQGLVVVSSCTPTDTYFVFN